MAEDGAFSGLLAGALGALLGVGFYMSLGWTVRRALHSPRPGVWFVGSLALRTVVALAGIHAIAGTHWQRLLLCLLGFLMARPLVARLTRPAAVRAA